MSEGVADMWRAAAVGAQTFGELSGFYFMDMEGRGKGCARARAFVCKQSLPARIVGWVRFTSRSAERRARKVKVGGRSPLSRILLRIPMHRFPAYRWGEWKLGATQGRAHGPAVGEMVIMVWDNSAARKELPLGTIALECLGEACRGELADGISDLRSKVDGGWVEMISLVKPPPAQELNWLRRPTAGIGDLVWRGAMPKAGITALGSSTRAWSPARRRKLGRSVLRILYKV